jgi:hypothetical protein
MHNVAVCCDPHSHFSRRTAQFEASSPKADTRERRVGVPAEGLLGYASSLRDRRRQGSGVQLGPTAKLSNPSCFMSGVRRTCKFDTRKPQEMFL